MVDPMPFPHADRPMPALRPAHGLGLTPWGAAAGIPARAADGEGPRRFLRLILALETLLDWLGEGLRRHPDAIRDGGGIAPAPPQPAPR